MGPQNESAFRGPSPPCPGPSDFLQALRFADPKPTSFPRHKRRCQLQTHHKASDPVGAGKESGRVCIHLLVLKPGGCAVGSLPAQSLPEGICEGRSHQLPRSTTHQTPDQTVPKFSWLLSTLRCQGSQDGRRWKDRPGEGKQADNAAQRQELYRAGLIISSQHLSEAVEAQRQQLT